MRQKLFIFLGSLLVLAGLSLGTWYLLTPPSFPLPPIPTDSKIPTPETFTTEGKIIYTPPHLQNTPAPFDINAKAGTAFNLTTGQVFWAKSAHTPHFIASLSKIMTAVVALELADPDHLITISSRSAQVGESTMNIKAGEVYTLEELLWGLMLHSANDSAEAIAEGLAGRSRVFTQLMNQKAKQLGLKNTFFVNPSGLDENLSQPSNFLTGKTYNGQTGSTSSINDLVVLTKYALDNYPLIAQIAKTQEKVLGASSHHPQKYLFNVMQLSRTYPGIIGIKSGNSHLAGLTVIELAQKEGQQVLIILLASPSPRQEVVDLLDYSLAQVE